MEITSDLLFEKAARGEDIPAHEVMELARKMEQYESRMSSLERKLDQKVAQVDVLKAMTSAAMMAAGSSRSIDTLRELTKLVASSDAPLFNAFEVRQCICALDTAEESYMNLKVAYDQIDVESSPARTLEQVISDLDSDKIGPFSFKEVRALLDYFRPKTMSLGRKPKTNIRELMDTIKAGNEKLFHLEEIRMVRQWGQDHERNADTYKRRFGKAFTDPVGYMDRRVGLIMSPEIKRDLLNARIMFGESYQHGVYARPDMMDPPETWKLCDGKTQFHAGEHFHTRACDGMWWCGTHFNHLTGPQLMKILETALADLRLLYSHFPNGVTNEEPAK